jgi:cyanophycinase
MNDRTSHAGWLMLIGGSNGDMLRLDLLKEFARKAGGENTRLLIVPTASSETSRIVDKYRKLLHAVDVTNILHIDVNERDQADQSENLEGLEQATAVLFTGGDQLRLVTCLRGTRFMTRLIERFSQGLPVAGTSAGAMALGDPMIVGGEGKEFYLWDSIPAVAGLGLCPKIVIDTHLVVRARLGRLLTLVAGHPHALGVGIEEDCAALISPEGIMTPYGKGIIMLVDGSEIGHNNISEIGTGDPISVEGFRLHILAQPDRFHLPSRKFLTK